MTCMLVVSPHPAQGVTSKHYLGFRHADLDRTFNALDDGLEYMVNNIGEINLDAVIGIREVQGRWSAFKYRF